MKAFFEFAGNHPCVTVFCCGIIADAMLQAWRRACRALIVSKQGWPPPHLDADGDFKPHEDAE